MISKVTRKEEQEKLKEVSIEDEVPDPDPIFQEDSFLKSIKYYKGKSLEGVPLFSGKMEVEFFMEWIEGMENHFECENINKAKKLRFLSQE